jgi:ABC-type multidrug transport system fused ATPase/permease subunit
MMIYGMVLLMTSITFLVLSQFVLLFNMSLKAAKVVHNNMISRVLSAPLNLYFDITPIGNIMNRFSKDLDVLDFEIVWNFHDVMLGLYHAISVIIIISYANVYILTIIPFLMGLAICLFRFTINAYR